MQFQLSYFKSWKMMLWKCYTQYASKFGKLSSGHRTGKVQFSFQSPGRAKSMNVQSTTQLPSFHILSMESSKFSKRGYNSTWTKNFQMFKLDLEKAEEPEIKLPTYVGSLKKQENSRKTSSVSLTTLKPLCGSQKTVENSSRWEYRTTLPASCETSMQVKTEQLELDMEQWTGLKLGKEKEKKIRKGVR